MKKRRALSEIKKCVFCKGTGIAKCFDLNTNLPDGSFDLNELINNKGTYEACPEGCQLMN